MVAGKGILSLPNGLHNFSNNNPEFEPAIVNEFTGPWLGVSSITFNSISVLSGNILFKEGFQFSLNFKPGNIMFGVDGLYGEPINCDVTPFNPSLTNDCDSIVSFINGVGPTEKNLIRIEPGSGVVILNDPDNHRIYLGFSFSSVNDICKPIPNRPE
jgi:hypothetical protein